MYTNKKSKYTKKNATKKRGGAHPGFLGPATNLVKNTASSMASKAISGASNFLGVDITNKDQVNSALEREISVLSDPKIREKMQEVIRKEAEVLAAGLQASQPAINQLVNTTTEAIEKSANKIGNAGVNIALNTLEEIPMLGILVGTIRSLDKAVQAAESVVDAGSEIVASSGDALGEVAKNINDSSLNKQIKEKSQLLNKVGGSIADFHDSTLNPRKIISKNKNKTRRQLRTRTNSRLFSL